MNEIILGEKGSGKTKKLVALANDSLEKSKGHNIFIDFDNSNMFQVDYRIRFIGVRDYQILSEDQFIGFISGVVASNYDIEKIFIDNLYKITGKNTEELEKLFEKMSDLELKYNVSFIVAINGTKETMPEFLNNFKVEEI